ncbi:hypothetical protein [Microvirga sp. P5_D2]
MDRLYSKTRPWLRRAAERNVVAHLLKLQAEGLVGPDGEPWRPSKMASCAGNGGLTVRICPLDQSQ